MSFSWMCCPYIEVCCVYRIVFFSLGPAVAPTHGSKGGVSHKIQQLLNTLKRPKKNRRPIEEYYQDEDGASKHLTMPL